MDTDNKTAQNIAPEIADLVPGEAIIGPYSSDQGFENEPETLDESSFEKTVVEIKRVTKVVKGGKKLSFTALVVVGNKQGQVGYALGKAKDVPAAIEKAGRRAMKSLIKVPMVDTTIPHMVQERFGATTVMLKPAKPGTGVIAGTTLRAVMDAAGIADVLTKIIGSSNPLNVIQAAFAGIRKLRTREQIAALRQ